MAALQYPKEAQEYNGAAFPALKFYLPFNETSGGTFADIAGGITCTATVEKAGVMQPDTSLLTFESGAIVLDGISNGGQDLHCDLMPSQPFPAPNGKVCVLLIVWGPFPASAQDDIGYLRFGSLTQQPGADANTFTMGMNSKATEANANPFKSMHSGQAYQFSRVTPANIPTSMAVVVDYESASSVRVDNWINTTKVTMVNTNPALIADFTAFGDRINVESNGLSKTMLYSIQLWHFQTKPNDAEMAAAMLWTRDKALTGVKAPYPLWKGKT